MPSSLLFAGLVTAWLAVLVPMAARRRQAVPRPSDAALAGRVLVRPRRGEQEVTALDAHTGYPDSDAAAPRYRPGRGGYDPAAAALAARARYASRQRIVAALVLAAVATGLLAAGVRLPVAWYAHIAVDVLLVGYLVYLRVQVREEQRIRSRRAARMAGSRWADGFGPAHLAEDRDEDDPRPDRAARDYDHRREYDDLDDYDDLGDHDDPDGDGTGYAGDDDRDRDPGRTGDGRTGDGRTGVGGERGPDQRPAEQDAGDRAPRDRRRGDSRNPGAPDEPGLPRLRPAAPPERPRGTVVLELDDEDPELHDLDPHQPPTYRRASGQ